MADHALMSSILEALESGVWLDVDELEKLLAGTSRRQILKALSCLIPDPITSLEEVRSEDGAALNSLALEAFCAWLARKRRKTRVVQIAPRNLLVLADLRGHLTMKKISEVSPGKLVEALNAVDSELTLIPHGTAHTLLYQARLRGNLELIDSLHNPPRYFAIERPKQSIEGSHLWQLEQESIHIIREAVDAAHNPAMLFSLGKDSMVMLRLAEKAFAPEKLPFPLVNIDTRWKFQEMNSFREWIKTKPEFDTIHYINPDALESDINPFDHGSAVHTDITKTQALRKLLDNHGFDFVFGGARRDEEKSRAKERMFSVRDRNHGWDPKNQRPELWDFYNTTLVNGQTMRVFPLSNWTERDIWAYLEVENVPLVPLYFAKIRPCVSRNGSLIMIDDERFRLEENEKILFKKIRFRSLGCYPLSGGVESQAEEVSEIGKELELSRMSERSSRVIDFDRGASMEQKKKVGYF